MIKPIQKRVYKSLGIYQYAWQSAVETFNNQMNPMRNVDQVVVRDGPIPPPKDDGSARLHEDRKSFVWGQNSFLSVINNIQERIKED